MTKRITKIIYYTTIALISLWFTASGFFELTKNPVVWDLTLKLGYPAYFIYLLGIAKLLGVIILLIPGRLLRLKDWVFAGLFFDIVFAFVSKAVVLGLPATSDAIVALILLSTGYVMFRKMHTSVEKLSIR
jgi:hypothetical protein